jgi:hypothetical protein
MLTPHERAYLTANKLYPIAQHIWPNENIQHIISNIIKHLHKSNAFTDGMTLPGPLYIPTARWKCDDELTSFTDTTTLCHIVGKTTQNVVWENTIPPGDWAPIRPFFMTPTHDRWKTSRLLICPQLSRFPDDTSVLAIVSPNVPYPEFRPNSFSN